MKTHRSIIYTALILLFSLCLAWASTDAGDAGTTGEKALIEWRNFENGITRAKAQNKKIFLYFYADWCTYCKKMEQTTFRDPKVVSYLNDNYVAITVNSDKEKKVASAFGVRGLPTAWFLKADAGKLSTMPGFIDSDRLLTILKFINTESYKKMSYRDFKESQ